MYNTSKVASGKLVGSLLGGTALNYIGHKACVCGVFMGARKDWQPTEMVDLDIKKDLAGVQDRNRLHR